MPKIDLALLLELRALMHILRENPPPGLYVRVLEADNRLDAALAPLLTREVEVVS